MSPTDVINAARAAADILAALVPHEEAQQFLSAAAVRRANAIADAAEAAKFGDLSKTPVPDSDE